MVAALYDQQDGPHEIDKVCESPEHWKHVESRNSDSPQKPANHIATVCLLSRPPEMTGSARGLIGSRQPLLRAGVLIIVHEEIAGRTKGCKRG